MRRVLAIFASLFLAAPALAQPVRFPDGLTSSQPGGLMIIRKGNQTTWSLGGGVFSQHVKIVTQTPAGTDIARFKMPSAFHRPNSMNPLPAWMPASLEVQVPDPHALLFVDSEKIAVRGTVRQLESPLLAPGKAYPLRVRAAYVVGANFLIEDKELVIRAGETTLVTFDGSRALVVALKKNSGELGPAPAAK